jgi:hypothetical protein
MFILATSHSGAVVLETPSQQVLRDHVAIATYLYVTQITRYGVSHTSLISTQHMYLVFV